MRAKPTNELRAKTHHATDNDYATLANAVVKAVLNREKDIYIRLPYFVELAEDWPKGVLVSKDSTSNTYKVKSYKAAAWLHDKGYLPTDAHGVMLAQRNLTYKIAAIEKMLEGNVKVCDNDVSGDSEQKEGKNASDDES